MKPSKIFENQNDTVFSVYTPLRNYIRKANLTTSLRAIHAHMQFMQFKQNLPSYIVNLPLGYANCQKQLDFIQFGLMPWELEILAKELIIHGAPVGSSKNLEDWNHLAEASNKLKFLDNEMAKIYANEKNVLIELTNRLPHRQFVWQRAPSFETVAKYWKIYSDSELSKIITRATGLTVRELYLIGMALTGFFLTKFALLYPPNINLKSLEQKHLEHFLKHFSIPFQALKENLIKEQEMNEKYSYAYHSLKTYPIIKMDYFGKEALICPIPTFLYRRITEGLYYEICNMDNFDIAFGNSFQNFTGELIEKQNKKLKIIPEQAYGKPEKRTSDWVVIDNSAILFIECKSKRLTLGAKISLLNQSEIHAQLDKMADFVIQTYKSILDYKNNKFPHLKYAKDKPVYPLVVTLEDWFLFGHISLNYLDQRVREKLKSLGLKEELVEEMPYTVCSVDELNLLAGISLNNPIEDIISGKHKDEETKRWQLETYLYKQYPSEIGKIKSLFTDEFDVELLAELPTIPS